MRLLRRREAPEAKAGFDPASQLGSETVTQIDAALSDRIDILTYEPYCNGGLLAATHMVVFNDPGFSQRSSQQRVRSAIEDKIDGLPKDDRPVPEWALGLYAPAMSAAAILYGRRPTEEERGIIRNPLFVAVDSRIEQARRTAYRKADQPFSWSYAADELAHLRILLGEEDFQTALSTGADYMMLSTEGLKQQFTDSLHSHIKNLAGKNSSKHPKTVGMIMDSLATLRIIGAHSVEIIEDEGLSIVDDKPEPSLASIGEESGKHDAITNAEAAPPPPPGPPSVVLGHPEIGGGLGWLTR